MGKRHKNKDFKRKKQPFVGRKKTNRKGGGIDSGKSFPELMDLGSNVYLPEVGKDSSMKFGGRRPGRQGGSADMPSSGPLRRRPVEFVKSKNGLNLEERKMKVEKEPQTTVLENQKDFETLDKALHNLSDTSNENLQDFNQLSTDSEVSQEKNVVDMDLNMNPMEKSVESLLENQTLSESESEQNEIIIGGVPLRVKFDCNGSATTELPQESVNHSVHSLHEDRMFESDTSNSEILQDYIDEMRQESDSSSEDLVENGVPSLDNLSIREPDYGTLAEDHVSFDMDKVQILNIRSSDSCHQYLIKSFPFLGTDDDAWLDEDMLCEMLLENGMLHNRMDSYLRMVHGMFYSAPPTPTYSDVYISESEEEEEEYPSSDDLGEGLEQLVEFSRIQQRSIDILPSTALKTKGKGSKKKLDLDGYDLEPDLLQNLQDQYLSARLSHTDRKRQRKNKRLGITRADSSTDLLLKYPDTMHIQDIKSEFDQLLSDGNRNAIAFPPMDPHGLKTVSHMAVLYNMKSRKLGNGNKCHIVAIKVKRTYSALPDFNGVSRVLKQRPVFNRTDVKKSKVIRFKTGAHLNEGDVVGSHAPEIDASNVGRRLLEKLGWSKGQCLGVEGNKGISEPIVAKIKKTKSGLR